MVGLYHSVRLLPHIVYSDKFIIRIGYQSSMELDLRNIEKIKAAHAQIGMEDKASKETYYAMLSLDSPQYKIFLKEPALMVSSYGRRKYVTSVVFRTDEPLKMMEEIGKSSAMEKIK